MEAFMRGGSPHVVLTFERGAYWIGCRRIRFVTIAVISTILVLAAAALSLPA
jgi:hypothetical protein